MEPTRIMVIINNGLKNNHMKQNQLAKLMNVEKSTVNRWCTGRAVPEAETFLTICEILDTCIDGYLKLHISKDQKLINLYNMCDDDAKESALIVLSEIAKLKASIRK